MSLQCPEKFSPLEVRHLGRNLKELLSEFTYCDKEEGDITVPAGFITDFASIGATKNILFFPLYALLAGYGDHAATIHDYLYRKVLMSRKRADDVFYRALRDEGIARWRATVFYYGVRLFGGPHH